MKTLFLLCILPTLMGGCLKTEDIPSGESGDNLGREMGGEESQQSGDHREGGENDDLYKVTWISIPQGSYLMGSSDVTDEQPVHEVSVQGFELSEAEITVGQYRECVELDRCTPPSAGSGCTWSATPTGKENYPVNCIDWSQARTFAVWLGGDLPTEAQWEYAARGDEAYEYAGSNQADDVAWYVENSDETNPVKSKRANAFGLYDMSGNVREWTLDEWHESYEGAPTSAEQPWGELSLCDDECEDSAMWHVNRGGSWYDYASSLRVSFRYYDFSGNRDLSLGFRVAKRAE